MNVDDWTKMVEDRFVGKFYILDIRQRPDWSCLWWRPERRGYTTDIDQAGLYEESELRGLRDTDIPVPAALAQKCVRRTVERDELAGAMAEAGRPIKYPEWWGQSVDECGCSPYEQCSEHLTF